MRYQWDVQEECAFGIRCGSLELGKKIWEKNFGLIRIQGWPPCLHKAIGEFVTIQEKHRDVQR